MGSPTQWLLAQCDLDVILLGILGKVDFLGKPFIASVLAAINTFRLPKCELLPNRLT